MEEHVQPLPHEARKRFFGFLVAVFLVVLPFLYLYATGYRFDLRKPTNIVSTGGIYVAVDRAGADIYIDNELVRETRAFRRAFYAQSLDIGTHRVHVQKEGHHTWVKELPVVKHRVTEAEAFNLPLVPEVRAITEYQTATGSAVARVFRDDVLFSNPVHATTSKATSTLIKNQEFVRLKTLFGTTSTTTTGKITGKQIRDFLEGTTTPDAVVATSTTVLSGVKLHLKGEDLYAEWIGTFEEMPYYYCAPDFPRYTGTTTLPIPVIEEEVEVEEEEVLTEGVLMHPVQTIPKDTSCVPEIRIDRKSQEVRDFDFFPGSTDFVVVLLTDGLYLVEIDDRSWQNVQPLLMGENLHMHIENGNIFVYDGTLIYQILLTTE